MFNWINKKNKNNSSIIRDTLFGDMPISAWNGNNSSDEPWVSFQEAEKYLEADNTQMATQILRKIIETPNLESRHYIQSWHFLRSLGVNPPDDKAKEVYGVIVEVTMNQGVDIVAAYADHTARYFNYSGAAVIWEHPDDSLKEEIKNLLDTGKNIIQNIGPWEKERPGEPPKGQARVSMLTPSGLHFGQAPLHALANDEMGGPIIKAALNLMQALIKKNGEIST
jgi:hypothetical protein